MAREPLLRPEEIASLLSGGERAAPTALDESDAASSLYSLRRPVAIPPEAEAAARRRLERFAAALGELLGRELESKVVLSIQGFRQEQAGAAVSTLPQPAWILSFHAALGGGMVLALEPTSALSLVELALGGAGNASAGGGREPTSLETRVLDKLCAGLAGPLGAKTDVTFRGAFDRAGIPADLASAGQVVGVGLLELRIGGAERSGLLLATPGLLRAAAPSVHGSAAHVGPLAPRLARVPLEVRPVLRAGAVALSSLMDLKPGSLLRLEAREGDAFDLRVAGLALFGGHVSRDEHGALFHASRRRGRSARHGTKENP